MNQFKAVIFDFGGVFTTSPVERFAEYERKNGLPDRFIGGVIKHNHHTNAFARYERAEINQQQFGEEFAAETKAAGHEISGETFLTFLQLDLKQIMIDAHQRVMQSGRKTGCITNNLPGRDSTQMLDSQEKVDQAAKVMSSFDVVIESSKAGVRKPEPRIYEMMLQKLDLPASACIFLDDLGINLKPAKALGMTTIKVPFGDVTPAIETLYELLGDL